MQSRIYIYIYATKYSSANYHHLLLYVTLCPYNPRAFLEPADSPWKLQVPTRVSEPTVLAPAPSPSKQNGVTLIGNWCIGN